MIKLRKYICALLCLAMLAGTVACAESNDDGNTEDTVEATETEAETEESDARLSVTDGIPEGVTFGGEDFVTITQNDKVDDVYIEALTGDIVDDDIFNRNQIISERFDTNILEPENMDYDHVSIAIQNSVNAQDDYYDLVLQHAVQSGNDALKGYFGNWYDVKYMDFTQPWYPQKSIENLTLNNHMYVAVSDIAKSALGNTYCMLFDKVYAANQNINNIYELVNNGQWTIDKMMELTKDVYVDENGNNKYDDDDFYGFISTDQSCTVTYLWAFDDPIFEITDDYQVELTFNNEKTIAILDTLRTLYWNTEGSLVIHSHSGAIDSFVNGRGIFANALIGFADTYLRDYENDYGIIPYPKWNESQTDYLTMSDGNFSTIAYLTTVQNTDFTGAITHALGCYSYKYVIPDYYDVALKVKGTRDEESVAILDMIVNGRSIDFAYIYDCWKGFVFDFQDLAYENSKKEFSSFYSKNEKSALKHYQEVIDMFVGVSE